MLENKFVSIFENNYVHMYAHMHVSMRHAEYFADYFDLSRNLEQQLCRTVLWYHKYQLGGVLRYS